MEGIGILKAAHYLPSKINTNADVCENIFGLTEDWIILKTGIKKRHHVQYSDTCGLMAREVALRLIEETDPRLIGLIIVCSFSQDYMLPPMSALIHYDIAASKHCQIMDINVNCVGLITGTTIAVERMLCNDEIDYALVIGAEILSRFVDKTDKFTAPFFSDGASGVLLGRVDNGALTLPKKAGFIHSKFCTDSSVYESVRLKRRGFIEHNGKATWNQAITNLPYVVNGVIYEAGFKPEEIDFFIFHQANEVLIHYIMDKMKIPREKTYTNVAEIGNTGAASIGIALSEAMEKGLIKEGSLLVMAGVGAGFNFGANLWRM